MFLAKRVKKWMCQVLIWHKTVNMTVGSHNFVKFTVIKSNCQKHSGCIFASGKNVMYPHYHEDKFVLS